jgi:hypothetical protein
MSISSLLCIRGSLPSCGAVFTWRRRHSCGLPSWSEYTSAASDAVALTAATAPDASCSLAPAPGEAAAFAAAPGLSPVPAPVLASWLPASRASRDSVCVVAMSAWRRGRAPTERSQRCFAGSAATWKV